MHKIEDLVSEAMLQFLIRLDRGEIKIPTYDAACAYMMQSCKWNLRDTIERDRRRMEAQLQFLNDEGKLLCNYDDGECEIDLLDESRPEMSEQDEIDEYYRDGHIQLMLYLEELIVDGVFSFKQVNLFKCYYINNYSFEKLAEATGYCKSTCFKHVDTVRKHIRENRGIEF